MPELSGASDTLFFAGTSVNGFRRSHSERFLHSNYAIGSSITRVRTLFFPRMARKTGIPDKTGRLRRLGEHFYDIPTSHPVIDQSDEFPQ
jgi:hypothetical protein